MVRSNYTKKRSVPSLGTSKTSPTTTNFAKGINTFAPNDMMGYDQLRVAQNARFDRSGEYKTRKGLRAFTKQPVGYSSASSNTSATKAYAKIGSANDYQFSLENSSSLYSVTLQFKKLEDKVLRVGIFKGSELVSTAFVNLVDGGTGAYEVKFNDVPDIAANTAYRVHVESADGSETTNEVYATSNSAKTIICEVHTCTAGEVTNVFEANINGAFTYLFAFKDSSTTKIYRSTSGGTPTLVKDLGGRYSHVRFNQTNNKIRCTYGGSPCLIDPAKSWAFSTITTTDLDTGTDLGIKVTNIIDGNSDNFVYFDAGTTTRAVWTWPSQYINPKDGKSINSYDKFNQNFVQNFPKINTGDPLSGMAVLGGVYYMLTRRKKYQMYAQTVDNWSTSACSAQNGTFSQESMVQDLNYVYFANDSGIYAFDGSSEFSLTEGKIQNVWDAIPANAKKRCALDLFDNRLYVWYPDDASGSMNCCLVYNIEMKLWESFDTGTFVSSSCGRQSPSHTFVCGHSRCGLLLENEAKAQHPKSGLDADYADLNSPIHFELDTAYNHFGTTSQLKRIVKWRPEFASATTSYTVKCGYALDFSDVVRYAFSVDVKDNTTVVETGAWDYGSDFGIPHEETIHTTSTKVYSEFYRCQLRYQHVAAYQPVTFRSHTVTVQTQRIR